MSVRAGVETDWTSHDYSNILSCHSGELSDGFGLFGLFDLFNPEWHFLSCFWPYHFGSVIVKEATCERLAGSGSPAARLCSAKLATGDKVQSKQLNPSRCKGHHEIEPTADHLSDEASESEGNSRKQGLKLKKPLNLLFFRGKASLCSGI